MKVKVCGIRTKSNLKFLDASAVDMIGFIFYDKSKRNFEEGELSEKDMLAVNKLKVGVFVNESIDRICVLADRYALDYIQLHGNESVAFCESLKRKGLKLIKAFAVYDELPSNLKLYEPYVDYFLFDAKGENYGGNGVQFDWVVLEDYRGARPYLLSGGIGPADADGIMGKTFAKMVGVDVNSGFEISPGLKKEKSLELFINQMKKKQNMDTSLLPNERGYFGSFGGAFIPEMMQANVTELQEQYLSIINTDEFKTEFDQLLSDYVGRPSPLYYAPRLSAQFDATIYLKREDLNHTGSHKINNALGQIILAKKLNKKRIIAETGAGQHGVATATACALMGLECVVFMGEVDVVRQAPNVGRMKMLGAKVVSVDSGSKTLKDATNEAMRYWIANPFDTHYIIGSVVGPHPYPDMVARFQSIISKEIKHQLNEKTGAELPDRVVACVGGGSNATGAFFNFIEDEKVELVAVEAAGKGLDSGFTAAATFKGKSGVLHGSKTLFMQTEDGQVVEPHSISAGLDYPGIGPALAHWFESGRVKFVAVTDDDALAAGMELCKLEGIIPAVESAHALAGLKQLNIRKREVIVVNLSGRGDKDLETYLEGLSE